MPVIKREEVDPKIRAAHEKAYKVQLKKALTDPMLTLVEKEHIKEQLASIGKPKIYRSDSPVKPGAISFD